MAHEYHSTTVAMVQVRMMSTSCTTNISVLNFSVVPDQDFNVDLALKFELYIHKHCATVSFTMKA